MLLLFVSTVFPSMNYAEHKLWHCVLSAGTQYCCGRPNEENTLSLNGDNIKPNEPLNERFMTAKLPADAKCLLRVASSISGIERRENKNKNIWGRNRNLTVVRAIYLPVKLH